MENIKQRDHQYHQQQQEHLQREREYLRQKPPKKM